MTVVTLTIEMKVVIVMVAVMMAMAPMLDDVLPSLLSSPSTNFHQHFSLHWQLDRKKSSLAGCLGFLMVYQRAPITRTVLMVMAMVMVVFAM